MQHTTYSWSKRMSFGVDPEVVGKTVESIASRDGHCAPATLVDEARPEDSPLHPLFTWDDTAAADSWRVHEARRVINSLVVRVERNGKEEDAPAFLSVGHRADTQALGEGYRTLAVVVGTPEMREEALDEALGRLRSYQRRYQMIGELGPVWEALDEIEEAQATKKPRKVRRLRQGLATIHME